MLNDRIWERHRDQKDWASFSVRKQTWIFWILYYKIDLSVVLNMVAKLFGFANPQHYKIKLSGKRTVFLTLKKLVGVIFFLFFFFYCHSSSSPHPLFWYSWQWAFLQHRFSSRYYLLFSAQLMAYLQTNESKSWKTMIHIH